MIKFTKVKLHNFLSYKDAELELDNQGVTLIEGTNNSNDAYTSSGSGKSSLLSAVTYAIYGKTVSGLSSDSVINKESGTDCSVILEFSIDKSDFRIERYRKGKQGNRNKLKLLLNDNEITEATTAKTQASIDKLIGIDFNTYVNTISYGSSEEPVFTQATDKGKKEILENLANTAIYEQARAIASNKAKEAANEADKADYAINTAQTSLQSLKDSEQREKELIEETAKRQKVIKASLSDLKAKRHNYATSTKKQLTGLKSSLQGLHSNKPQSDIGEELNKETKKITSAISVVSEAEGTVSQITNHIKDLKKQYRSLQAKTVCPVCGRPLDEEHKASEKTNLLTKIKLHLDKYNKASKAMEQAKAEYTKEQTFSKELYNKSANFSKKLESYNKECKDIEDQINTITNTLASYDNKIAGIESSIDTTPIKSHDYAKEITAKEEEISKLQTKSTTLEKQVENYKTLSTKVFSRQGITSMLMDLITPYLNEHANYYLNKLSGSVLSIDMHTQTVNANKTISDKFDLQVTNTAGADSYQNCSAGERKRIDIAIAFAIQDLQQEHSNTATNIAIYDECFDGLDSVGCESVIEVLKEKAKTTASIFVITHNDTLKPLFDNSIKVTKDAMGISTIGK